MEERMRKEIEYEKVEEEKGERETNPVDPGVRISCPFKSGIV